MINYTLPYLCIIFTPLFQACNTINQTAHVQLEVLTNRFVTLNDKMELQQQLLMPTNSLICTDLMESI